MAKYVIQSTITRNFICGSASDIEFISDENEAIIFDSIDEAELFKAQSKLSRACAIKVLHEEIQKPLIQHENLEPVKRSLCLK